MADPSRPALDRPTPRIVQAARVLGYVSAAFAALDIGWVCLGNGIPDARYMAGVILLSFAYVVSGTFAFLAQNEAIGRLAEQVKVAGTVTLEMPNADVYELGREIGREEALRGRGEEDRKR